MSQSAGDTVDEDNRNMLKELVQPRSGLGNEPSHNNL